MAVEIQLFILCGAIEQAKDQLPTLKQAGIYELLPNGSYPIAGSFPFFLLLRKATKESTVEFTAQIRVLDADGGVLRRPGTINIKGTFPAGYRFWRLSGKMTYSFPRKGSYTTVIDLLSQGTQSQFRYDIECVVGSPR